jgi:hypothetical protein
MQAQLFMCCCRCHAFLQIKLTTYYQSANILCFWLQPALPLTVPCNSKCSWLQMNSRGSQPFYRLLLTLPAAVHAVAIDQLHFV